jgi:polyisoprenoid-binding protein YceI
MKISLPLLVALTLTWPVASLTAQQSAATSWTVGATGNSAQYRVREQLAGVEFENDAVGVTREITGKISIDAAGAVLPEQSRITIGLASLTSDKDRRDGYVRRRTLDTDNHPSATLAVTGFEGLSGPLPDSGTVEFILVGTLTIKERTIPTKWEVVARFAGDHLTGSASTSVTFEEIGLDKPRVMAVLSVKDTIKLEYEFHLVRDR